MDKVLWKRIVVTNQQALLGLDISDQSKVQLINSVGEIDFRLSEGADERIQLEASNSRIRLLSQKDQLTSI